MVRESLRFLDCHPLLDFPQQDCRRERLSLQMEDTHGRWARAAHFWLSSLFNSSATLDVISCGFGTVQKGLPRGHQRAQRDVQYAVCSLEKEAFRNRFILIEQAAKSLEAPMERTSKMAEAEKATRRMLFSLQTTRIKLDAGRSDTESKIASAVARVLGQKLLIAPFGCELRYPWRTWNPRLPVL